MPRKPAENPRTLSIRVGEERVSGLLCRNAKAREIFVFAHGAGAGMRHDFMERFAKILAELGVATLRYQFPYMEKGSKRPDRTPLCVQTVRAAIACAKTEAPDLPLFVGGKSMGGRMTSQALADLDDLDVKGVIFLGFPLHPAKKEATVRAEHLLLVQRPMFFVQGTRDVLANLQLMQQVWDGLGERAAYFVVEGADHGFGVLKRGGRSQDEVSQSMGQAVVSWMRR